MLDESSAVYQLVKAKATYILGFTGKIAGDSNSEGCEIWFGFIADDNERFRLMPYVHCEGAESGIGFCVHGFIPDAIVTAVTEGIIPEDVQPEP